MLKVGTLAPDFVLEDHTRRPVKLSEFRGQTVVLWFFPRADTPGCTVQGIGFQDRLNEYQALNVQILGISRDTPDANRGFAERYGMTFPLLSDESGQTCMAYEAWEGMAVKRITYVIGPNGQIVFAIENLNAREHPIAVLDYLYKSRNPTGYTPNTLVYALGQIGFDFGKQPQIDFLSYDSGYNPHHIDTLLMHLDDNPHLMPHIIWTLNLEGTPIYALKLAGAFSGEAEYREYLRDFLIEQLDHTIERISVPGVLRDQITLFSGQVVPVIEVALQGMYSWTTEALLESVHGPNANDAAIQVTRTYLERVYYAHRNLGRSSRERALNYAATNALQAGIVATSAAEDSMTLHHLDVEPSVICRPDADCWDVTLFFFNPANRHRQARRVYRFTVDVSDVIPVPVGDIRSWSVYR